MREALDKQAVRDWLSGQRAAAERIEAERARFLLTLTPQRSLRLYLSLPRQVERGHANTSSPLLMAMRRVLARAAEEEGRGR